MFSVFLSVCQPRQQFAHSELVNPLLPLSFRWPLSLLSPRQALVPSPNSGKPWTESGTRPKLRWQRRVPSGSNCTCAFTCSRPVPSSTCRCSLKNLTPWWGHWWRLLSGKRTLWSRAMLPPTWQSFCRTVQAAVRAPTARLSRTSVPQPALTPHPHLHLPALWLRRRKMPKVTLRNV